MIVYLLTSPSGKRYVGQTIQSMDARWSRHVQAAMTGKWEFPIHRAIRKHGADGWTRQIIWTCDSQEHMDLMEGHFIAVMGDYNATLGGDSPGKLTEETRDKMSASAKKAWSENPRTHTEEAKRRVGDANRGRIMPPKSAATKEKLRKAQTGKKLSDETKAKISARMQGNKRCVGRKHSQATKDKIRAALLLRNS